MKIFNSVSEAARFYKLDGSGVSKSCLNKNRLTGKYKWAYLDDFNKDSEYFIELDKKIPRKKVFSEETKQKMSKLRKGREVSEETKVRLRTLNSGKKFSEETKQKMSNSTKKQMAERRKDICKFNEFRKKLSDCHKGSKNLNFGKNAANSRKVINLDTDEIFNSVTEASNKYNILRQCITSNCKGNTKTAGKYRWAYYTTNIDQAI
jgi:hypothetical protein